MKSGTRPGMEVILIMVGLFNRPPMVDLLLQDVRGVTVIGVIPG